MASSEEPIQALAQESSSVKELTEQAKILTLSVPRPFGFMDLIYQWQPMGIRAEITLPFEGDDEGFFFVLRNGPFVPRWDHQDPNDRGIWWFNNLRNVLLQPSPQDGFEFPHVDYPDNYGVKLIHFDYPPFFSTASQMFRRWRGDIQYRFRFVSSFASQGYIVVMPLKNEIQPIGIYDENSETPLITRKDLSYRAGMMGSYTMSDVSMFRHVEVNYPYDYPVGWYDQYWWIQQRSPPDMNFTSEPFPIGTWNYQYHQFTPTPHGDNWIAVGLRGAIASQQTGKISIDIEYRAAEGFQFAEPGLPPSDMLVPKHRPATKPNLVTPWFTPNSKAHSNGVNILKPKTETADRIRRDIPDMRRSPVPGTASRRMYPTLPHE